MEAITGVNELARGTSQVSRRSAAEANILYSSATGRATERRIAAAIAASGIAGRTVVLAQRELKEEHQYEARVSNEEGEEMFLPYSVDDIQGDFDFEVEMNSMAPRDEAAQRADAIAYSQLLANPAFAEIVDLHKFAQKILLPAIGVDDPDSILKPHPQVLQEQQMKMMSQFAGGAPAGGNGAPPGDPATAHMGLNQLELEAAQTSTEML